MKKLLILTTLLAGLLTTTMSYAVIGITGVSGRDTARAQSPFFVHLSTPADTAPSIFCQQAYIVKIPDLNYNWDEAPDFYPVIMAASQGDTSYLEVRFPTDTNWFFMRRLPKMPPGHRYDLRIDSLYLSGHRPFAQGYVNTLPLFAECPGLWEASLTGGPLLLRSRLWVSENGNSFHFVYSNIDTLYLPPATPEDISAFNYLKSHVTDIRDFSYLDHKFTEYPAYTHLIANYPGTMIGEIAKYLEMLVTASRLRVPGSGYTNDQVNEWLTAHKQAFITSKSDLIMHKANNIYGWE